MMAMAHNRDERKTGGVGRMGLDFDGSYREDLAIARELATKAGLECIDRYLDGCSHGTIRNVKSCLHELIALQGHPSQAYATGVRAQIIEGIFDDIYPYDVRDYAQMRILDKVSYLVRRYRDITKVRNMFRVLCALWDETLKDDPVDYLDEIVEGWEWYQLREDYLDRDISDGAIEAVAGRAIKYRETGLMFWTVPAKDAKQVFGW